MLPEYKHILYATDLSESARLALRHAVSLAERYGAQLTILHAVADLVDLMSENAGFDIEAHFDAETWSAINAGAEASAREAARRRIADMAAECATAHEHCPVAKATIIIETGDPALRILEHTEGHDLIVMGAHGHGHFADLLLGSVARKVVRLSPVPVVTVRLPKNPMSTNNGK